MYRLFFKRFFDVILSCCLLIVVLPILLLCAVLIKLDSRGPVFFLQERAGMGESIIMVYKLRTMTDKMRATTNEIFAGNAEVTRIGLYLRKYKVDELPQLLNVLIGNLSLIGPRPLLPETIAGLNEYEKKRTHVKPGLSGLAQVNGNIYITREERLKYDVEYVENLSFILDVKILLKTILVIFKGEEKFKKK